MTRHTTLLDALTQEQTDGKTIRDTLLLLPLLSSSGPPYPFCLHPVHHATGKLAFCNRKTADHCACCHAPVCKSHLVSCSDFLPTEAGVAEAAFPLCETCAALPQEARVTLYAARLSLNQEQEAQP